MGGGYAGPPRIADVRLFEEGLVIVEHLFVEVQAVVAADVVFVVGVDEIIDLFAGFDAGIDELDAVLPDNGVVFGAMDDEEAAFEVFGLRGEGIVGIALGILLRGVHIAFAVHDFVPFPVDDRAAGAADFEDFGVGEFHGDGHESAEAPAFDTHAGLIDVGE